MKLSKETLELLKNFAAINMSILFRTGSTLKTISPQKNVMAMAEVKEVFSREVALYDLNQFLGTLSIFDDPELEFEDKFIRISDASSEAKYIYSSKESIVHAPNKDLVFPDPEVEFKLEEKALFGALKAANVMGLPNVSFVGENGDVFITATDAANSSASSWKAKVGSADSVFQLNFRLDLLKFLPRDYVVSISSKLLSRFVSARGDVKYFMAAETGSKFG